MASQLDSARIQDQVRGRVLELGCGARKRRAEYVGVDVLDYPGVDIVGDAFEVLRSVPDAILAGVYSSHFFEHIEDVPGLMDEVARVIRPRGYLEVIVPHFSNPYYYSDLTHKTAFGLYTFSYLARDEILRRKVPTYQRELAFELISVHLGFKSSPPFVARYGLKRVIELLVNASTWSMEFYEENLSHIVPCYELQYRLVRRSQTG
jgi:ubiquinone/menaquinone biosynthesis C-methylase UbiE